MAFRRHCRRLKRKREMKISALDHLVLTVADIDRTIAFYTQVLGMEEVSFGNNRKACILED